MTDRAAPLHNLTEKLSELSFLDSTAKPLGKTVRNTLTPGPIRDAMSGTWLGHALHPLLTDAVIGTWTSALLLDAVGGDDNGGAQRRLIGAGLAAYLPTAATGLMDWADSEAVDDGIRRIGSVHAVANAAGAGLQIASLRARRRGDHGKGVALSLAAGAALSVGGYLGAHLSFARGVGVDQTVFDPGDAEWRAALPAEELQPDQPRSVAVGDTPVLLVRTTSGVLAIHDRCSHRGCSLASGNLDGEVIECICHGSRFRLSDGGIERGPAVSPQPAFDTREQDGQIEVRRRLKA